MRVRIADVFVDYQESPLWFVTYDWMRWSTDIACENTSSNWIWNNNVYDDFGPDMDDHRASALFSFRPEYYKHDRRVKDWLDQVV